MGATGDIRLKAGDQLGGCCIIGPGSAENLNWGDVRERVKVAETF